MGASRLWWTRFVEKVSFEPGMMSVTRKKHIVAIRSDHPRLCVYCICIFVVFCTTKSRYTHEFMRLPPRSCRSVVLNWSLVQISAFVGSYPPLNRITEFSGDISGMIARDLTEKSMSGIQELFPVGVPNMGLLTSGGLRSKKAPIRNIRLTVV